MKSIINNANLPPVTPFPKLMVAKAKANGNIYLVIKGEYEYIHNYHMIVVGGPNKEDWGKYYIFNTLYNESFIKEYKDFNGSITISNN